MVTRTRPNIVDSSAWLAYFAGEPTADDFAAAIEEVGRVVVPAVCLLEVFNVVVRQRGEGDALQAVAGFDPAYLLLPRAAPPRVAGVQGAVIQPVRAAPDLEDTHNAG